MLNISNEKKTKLKLDLGISNNIINRNIVDMIVTFDKPIIYSNNYTLNQSIDNLTNNQDFFGLNRYECKEFKKKIINYTSKSYYWIVELRNQLNFFLKNINNVISLDSEMFPSQYNRAEYYLLLLSSVRIPINTNWKNNRKIQIRQIQIGTIQIGGTSRKNIILKI